MLAIIQKEFAVTEASGKAVTTRYEAEIAAILQRTLGGVPERLEAVPTYPDSIVYRAVRGAQDVILKAMDPQGRDPDGIGLEAWALERAAARDVPVPPVLELDLSATALPMAYLIMEQAAGVPLSSLSLSPIEQRPYLTQLGAALCQLHNEVVPGYGWLDERCYRADGHIQGGASSWRAALLDPLPDAVQYLGSAGVLTAESRAAIDRVIVAGGGLLNQDGPGRLLHGDLGPIHVWVDPSRRRLTALIDFGERSAGDPVWEFVDYGPGVPDILEGYAPDAPLRARFDDAFALYQLLRTIPWTARWHARGAGHVVNWLDVTLRRAIAQFG